MSAKKPMGLGKGFDALMPQGLDKSLLEKSKDKTLEVAVRNIKPNPDQPRRTFEPAALQELADSIKQYGVLQPLLVMPMPNNEYQIIAGERRWRASKLAGLEKVPVVIRTAKELDQLEIALVENIQRVDLLPLETAASIQRLHELFSMSYGEIAKRLNKAESTIANTARLLQLPPAARDALQEQKITEGHARSILALKDFPAQQEQLLIYIQKHGWSVRQAEQFAVAAKTGADTAEKAQKRTIADTPVTKELSKILGRQVTVNNMAKGGRLVIRFKTDDDLDKLVELLKSLQA